MTVSELIAQLQQHHPDRLVVMSKDAEGNGFRPLGEVQAAAYEEDVLHGQPALVLWPVNRGKVKRRQRISARQDLRLREFISSSEWRK